MRVQTRTLLLAWASFLAFVGICLFVVLSFGCQAHRDRETVETWMPVDTCLRYVDYENRDRGAER